MNTEQIESYRRDAANKYASMVVHMMKQSDQQFSPAVTACVMDLVSVYESSASDEDAIWASYAELVRVARLEGMKVDMAPMMAMRFMNKVMGE